jgi:hypothetical protein
VDLKKGGFPFLGLQAKITARISVVISLLIIALVIDTILGMVMDILYLQNNKIVFSDAGLLIYLLIFVIYAIGSIAITKIMIGGQNRNPSSSFKRLRVVNVIVNYSILVIMAILLGQLFLLKSYFTFTPLLIASLTYGISILNFGILSYILLKWFKINRNKIVVIFAAVAFVMCFNAINSLIFFDSVLILNTEPVIKSGSVPEYRLFLPFDQNQLISISQSASVAIYVSLTWVGLFFILKYNIRKIGKPLFFLIIVPPFLAVINLHVSSFSTIYPDNPSVLMLTPDANLQFMLYIVSFLLCAFLFGLGYISISRHVVQMELKYYTRITGLGFLLFYISGFSTILNHSFPPFGLMSLSLVGLSSYLMLIGLYYTAASISQDLQLRKSIKKTMKNDLEFFDSLGNAELLLSYQQKIIELMKKNKELLTQETGIEPSLSVDDAKEYFEDIKRELSRKQNN